MSNEEINNTNLPLKSEIVNSKKQLILKVDQTSDFVYPNELYKYQIYCKNVSGDTIEDVHIKIINPSVILINEDKEPLKGMEIGDLNNGQSHLLYLPARCNESGKFTVHFICYGEGSELISKSLTISSSYDAYNDQTIHKIHIYDFTPYEDKYELRSKDFSDSVTQLIKKQKLPYEARNNPFKTIVEDLNNNVIVDESQSYIDQKSILYDDPKNSDEHTYQYIYRENFNKESKESYEGQNLQEIFRNINKNSKIFSATFLRTGSNRLFNDFKQYNPNGFIYRFGLMNSEMFHHVGVIPDYTYMSDYLFRWAAEDKMPLNLYPQRVDMNWDNNIWAGHGWNVWKTYTDEYKEQIINLDSYTPMFEFIQTFDNLDTAKQYINNEYSYDLSNEYYINTEKGLEKIRKYQYIIKESYYDNGVFFVHIPISKIPSNFFLLTTEEIEAIIEKTKPYGMKALIKYVIDTNFNIDMSMKTYTKILPQIKLEFDNVNKINFSGIPYQYHNVIETVCSIDDNQEEVYEQRETLKMIPSGTGFYDAFRIDMDPSMDSIKADPTYSSGLDINTEVKNTVYKCEIDKKFVYLSDVYNLLYQQNFEDISFSINDISTISFDRLSQYNYNEEDFTYPISVVDYKLWVDCLSDNTHSRWWTGDFNDIDFFEMPLTHFEITQEGVESGIGFKDSIGKLHGISSEFDSETKLFKIKYATSMNNNFKIQKEGLADVVGIAFNFIKIGNHTLIIFFIKKQSNNTEKYYYFDHVIVNSIESLFCFTRNSKEISQIKKWSNIIRISRNTDPRITFNTPQYDNIRSYDSYKILNEDINWKNISRIDKNEHSYAVIQNIDLNDEMQVDSIRLHFDDIDIPNDAVVKSIKTRSIMETNTYKTIYPSIRFQDGFITEKSNINKISLYPSSIECYPHYNKNLDYYKEQYNIAKTNDIEQSIKFFESKILENELFDEEFDYSLDFLEYIDDFITVVKPYWIEMSDFSEDHISMNDINEIKFCIEGYNEGKEVYLVTQLGDEIYSKESKTLIQTGYFKKYVSLKYNNKFSLDQVRLRFRFLDLNDSINIFDTYIETHFKEKQNAVKEFEQKDSIDIEKKKIIKNEMIDYDIPGYILKDGFTIELAFDDLEEGEYYRIYSTELEIIYQKQNIDLLIDSNEQQIDMDNRMTLVSGKEYNNYMSGMFFNEVIMPETYQPISTLNSENQGIELREAIYQSFTATADNMTSFTIYPNGFVGNPDINLKIALYENKGNTPNKLIKQIRANGWTKENSQLKNASMITYDFNANNLIIGNKYWIKIEVENPSENNYYLLKYSDTVQNNLKLLTKINNNLINTFGSLKFHINTLNNFDSFNSLTAIEDKEDFSDPKIFLSLNKRIGEVKDIIIQKAGDINE